MSIHGAFFFIIPDKTPPKPSRIQRAYRTDYSLTKEDNIQAENTSYDGTWWKGKCVGKASRSQGNTMTKEVEQGNYGTDKWQRPVI